MSPSTTEQCYVLCFCYLSNGSTLQRIRLFVCWAFFCCVMRSPLFRMFSLSFYDIRCFAFFGTSHKGRKRQRVPLSCLSNIQHESSDVKGENKKEEDWQEKDRKTRIVKARRQLLGKMLPLENQKISRFKQTSMSPLSMFVLFPLTSTLWSRLKVS